MFTLEQVANICGGKLISERPLARVRSVVIDSRSVQAGDLFAALRGEHRDGHEFAREAIDKGAHGVLAARELSGLQDTVVVPDVLKAVQELARFHRSRFSIPTVAVTGSVGKTTTKECIGRLLAQSLRTCVGYGNWNNHIGVPLNLFKIKSSDECLVLELGANHLGEIAFLAELTQPTIGVITQISPAHLEGFGSTDGVYEAKLELAEEVFGRGGTMVANGDDPVLARKLSVFSGSVVTFGTRRGCDFVLSGLETEKGWIQFLVNDRVTFRLKGHGAFNAMNALAAIATASLFRYDLHEMSRWWHEMPILEGRFFCEHWPERDLFIVNDSYNANPASFEHSLAAFRNLAGKRRALVVAGDMLELGDRAVHYHEALGEWLAKSGIEVVISVGDLCQHAEKSFRRLRPAGRWFSVKDSLSAAECLEKYAKDGDAILIKGSHAFDLTRATTRVAPTPFC